MTGFARRGFLVSLVGLAAWCAGCSPGQMAYFLLPESKEDPEMLKLASDDKKKQVSVVILASTAGLPLSSEILYADRQLALLLAKQLHDQCKTNDENILIVGPNRVDEYKSTHSDWQEKPLRDVGKYFHADYVIGLEIRNLSLYERGSFNTMYRGRIEIGVELVNVNQPDQPSQRQDFHTVYPTEARPEQADADTTPEMFRAKLLNYVAKRLAWYFTPHRIRESYYVE
jgi:hypothetical protein